jgi:microcin C transport system substrate-binding protein
LIRLPAPSRRHVLGLGVGLGLGALAARFVRAAGASEAGSEAHGMSAFGDLKYAADFHHFD